MGVAGVIPRDEANGTAGEVLEGMVRLAALEIDRLE